MQELLSYIADKISLITLEIKPISGGDISDSYLLKTADADYFVKVNSQANALEMFEQEAIGLKTIGESAAIAVPQMILVDRVGDEAFLLLEYVETKRPNTQDFECFGRQLAALHHVKNKTFGFDSDNFIGSLPQTNEYNTDWTTFYVENRLLSQLNIGIKKGLLEKQEVPSTERLTNGLKKLMISIEPSLLHGDLWSGNYLISATGTPYLIDPAVYFGHREVDLAMTKLFGGFADSFYDAYDEILPPEPGAQERIDIYQLYFLLVHLNLFGFSYKPAVMRILRKYF